MPHLLLNAPRVGPSTGGGARAKPSHFGWEENAKENGHFEAKCWQVFTVNRGGLGLGFLCSFLISKSLSTGRQRVVSLGPKSGSFWIFQGPGRPRRPPAGPGRLREASWSFPGPPGPSRIQDHLDFGRWVNTHSEPAEKLSELKTTMLKGSRGDPKKWPKTGVFL